MFALEDDRPECSLDTRPTMTPPIRVVEDGSIHRVAVDVVISSLQKHIRRGNLGGALFYAYVLYLMKGACRRKLLQRLLVIGSEDIGVASLKVVPFLNWAFRDLTVPELSPEEFKIRFSNIEESLLTDSDDLGGSPTFLQRILTAVVLMSDSSKDRSVDHAIYPLIQRPLGAEFEDPKGEQRGGGGDGVALKEALKECLEEGFEKGAIFYAGRLGMKAVKEAEAEDIAVGEFRVAEGSPCSLLWDVLKSHYEQHIRSKDEDGLILRNLNGLFDTFVFMWRIQREYFLFVTHAIVLLCNAEEILANLADETSRSDPESWLLSSERAKKMVEEEICFSETADWCVDKHTEQGRALGRGIRHFIEVGSVLENRVSWREDPYFEAFRRLLLRDRGEE